MGEEDLGGICQLLLADKLQLDERRMYGWTWAPVSRDRAREADPEGKVHLLLDWSDRPRDVPDPWWDGDFDRAYDDVREGCSTLLAALLGHNPKGPALRP